MKGKLLIIYFMIGLIIVFCCNQLMYANKKLNNTTEVNSINYEIVYVNGNKYIVFKNSSGSDIEVIKAY